MDRKKEVCEYLRLYHSGREKAVHSVEIQRVFRIDGRTVRRNISKLRQSGFPICSDDAGYYFADSQREINGTVRRLNALLTRVSNARNGLLYAPVIAAAVPNEIEITVKLR